MIAMFASIGRRTREERWLLAEAVAALAVASFLIALVPFRRVALLARLPEGDAIYPDDYLTDQPERFFVAELVREQVLQQTRDELPFTTAVVVDKFEEADAKGLMRFYCTILVERETQKPILVGKAGSMIKAIGTAARKELEAFFDARVFLDLHVKVREGWREDERMLDTLGLPSKKRR